jgi:hypothetical protein
MISEFPKNTKIMIIAVVTSVFVSSLAFAYIMVTNNYVTDDESIALKYAAIFAVILITLNALLLAIALRASRKMKKEALTKKCASCGLSIERDETKCPGCNAVQVSEDTYLDPREADSKVISKKR